ncbi:TAFII28-domain-containing protein [Ascobolus immersus RN42]|uniref:Transcription initiation factor TFIID subunit 11 n=1 Tax=Ascobolus immersus RN42 TaxID=1160509 RepID=A0A3N4IN71_ASCIM|nr:TAFII28-domain-containing protein [Ascobolus immersus RN42]
MGVDDGAGDAEEKEAFRMLVDQFTPEQMHRYEAFRRGNLQKGSVKKLANQVLNQSITQSVATVIAGFTKIYIGEIVESALDIQEEWNQTGPLTPDHLREAVKRYRVESQGAVGSHVNGGGGMIGGDTGGPGPGASFGGGLGRMFR